MDSSDVVPSRSGGATDWKRKMNLILARLKRHPSSIYFLEPVDPVKLKVPLYPCLNEHPIDISSIQDKLESSAYKDAESMARDIVSMFQNALLFNGPPSAASPVYTAAKSMYESFCSLYVSKFNVEPPSPCPDASERQPFLTEEPRRHLYSGGISRAQCLAWAAALSVIVALGTTVVVREFSFPSVLKADDTPTDVFSEGRSYEVLQKLTDIGERVTRSSNAERARQLLLDEVAGINAAAHASMCGWAPMSVGLRERTCLVASEYWRISVNDASSPVQNVVLLLDDGGNDDVKLGTLLLSAHYDTVNGTTGATDDGTGVAVLVETARNLLAATDRPHQWRIIIALFDAEEVGAIGAQRFVKPAHPWLTTAMMPGHRRVSVNLEGSGSAGKAVLLRISSDWALSMFASSAPHPYAHSISQFIYNEVFRRGYTDLDTLMPLGFHAIELLALDHRPNYHTPEDSLENINIGALQHEGDNVLAFAKAVLAVSPQQIPEQPEAGRALGFPRAVPLIKPSCSFESLFGSLLLMNAFSYVHLLAFVLPLALFWLAADVRLQQRRALTTLAELLLRIVVCVAICTTISAAVLGNHASAAPFVWLRFLWLRVTLLLVLQVAIWCAMGLLFAWTQQYCCRSRKTAKETSCGDQIYEVESRDISSALALLMLNVVFLCCLLAAGTAGAPFALLVLTSLVSVAAALALDLLYRNVIFERLQSGAWKHAVAASWSYFALRQIVLVCAPLTMALSMVLFLVTKLPLFLDEMGVGVVAPAVFGFMLCAFALSFSEAFAHRLFVAMAPWRRRYFALFFGVASVTAVVATIVIRFSVVASRSAL